MHTHIEIHRLLVDCIIGVHPEERAHAQPIEVDLRLELDATRAVRSDALVDTLDYAALAAEVAFVLQEGRFQLLETACAAISAHLLAPPIPARTCPRVTQAYVRLRKPRALPSGIAMVTMEGSVDAVTYGHEQKPFGDVDILHESQDMGLYRLHIHPGRSIPWHRHQTMTESEMVLSDGLLRCDAPAPRLSIRRWKQGEVHRYVNPTATTQTVLCIDRPPFLESDEIPTERGH